MLFNNSNSKQPMIVFRAAEAVVTKDGSEAVKTRVKKGYRISELDDAIRRKRNRTEARLMTEARRAGVRSPVVTGHDEFSIRMEYIEGKKLRDAMNPGNCTALASMMAESMAKMHNAGIIHGDPTTSNMILKDGEVYMVDFGLGFRSGRAEDKATDLYLLREAMSSVHHEMLDGAWKTILKVYRKKSKDSASVFKSLNIIGKRRRYR